MKLINNLGIIRMPIVKILLFPLLGLVWVFKFVYKYMLPINILVYVVNLPLMLFRFRVVVGTSQTGSIWEDHYMMVYDIGVTDQFTCQDSKWISLLEVEY